MLLELMLYLGPLAIIICVVMAIRGTRVKKIEDCPTWLKTSVMNMNGSDRLWNLRR